MLDRACSGDLRLAVGLPRVRTTLVQVKWSAGAVHHARALFSFFSCRVYERCELRQLHQARQPQSSAAYKRAYKGVRLGWSLRIKSRAASCEVGSEESSERGRGGSRSVFSLSNAAAERCELLGILADRLEFGHQRSDALPFRRLWYDEPNAISNAVGYARFFSRSHDAMIRVYDEAGNVIETHEHSAEFKDW
jgi:hypothetical protein